MLAISPIILIQGTSDPCDHGPLWPNPRWPTLETASTAATVRLGRSVPIPTRMPCENIHRVQFHLDTARTVRGRHSRIHSEWAVERARKELSEALSEETSPATWLRRFAIAPGWGRLCLIGLAYAGVLFICIPLRNAPFHIWSSFAPQDPAQG